MSTTKAGPTVTDGGNLLVDCDFGEIIEPIELEKKINSIVGVVDCGLFCNMATAVYFGEKNG
jgi:ribose 5-phosphate isomerase A